MPLTSLDQVEVQEPQKGARINIAEIEGEIEYPGAVRTAVSNVARGATQSLTGPVEYVSALSGIEFLGDSARAVDEFVQDFTPVNPELADSWLATYIPQGLGQVGTMLVPGAAFFKAAQGFKTAAGVAQAAGKATEAAQLLAKAAKVETAGKVALYGLMGGAEGNDAYQRSIGEGDDHVEAVAKSLGYASVAAAIENKFGTGLLIRRMEGLMGREAAGKMLAEKGITQRTLQDMGMGAFEEGTQRAAQDLIVTGQLDPSGIGTEAGVGGIIQGLVGLPMNIAQRSMSPQQKAVVAKAEHLVKTGSPATAQVVLEETLSEPLSEEAISILEPGEQVTTKPPVAGAPSVETTQIATEQTTAPVPPTPIIPTPEVVSNLENGGAPLTAAAVVQVAATPTPVAPAEVAAPVVEAPKPAPLPVTPEPTTPKPATLEQDLNDLATAIQDIRQRIVAREQGVSQNVEVQEMRRQEEGRQGGLLTPPAPMGVTAQAVAPVAPETFKRGQRVTSDRYGKGEVLRQIGKRFQVQFDDGTKFTVSRQELTPDRPEMEAVTPNQDPIIWEDINGNPIHLSPKGTFYTIENGRVRTGVSVTERPFASGTKPQPVPASIVDSNNVPLPDGYVKEGDAYVYKADAVQALPSPPASQPKAPNKPTDAAQPLNWQDADTRTPDLDSAADNDFKAAQKRMQNLLRRETRLQAKEDLTEKDQENLLDVQAEMQEVRAVMQTYEDYQQRPADSPPKTALEAAKEEVKDAFNGLYKMGIQPDPGAQLRFYRAIYNLAVEAVKQGVKTAAEFIAQNPFYQSVSKTMEDAFNKAQNAQPLPATLDELPPAVVHEMEIAGVTVEPRVKEQAKVPKTGQALKNLLESEWAEKNPDLATLLRNQTYDSTTNANRLAIAKALVDFYGADLEAALRYAQIPPKEAGVSAGIQQIMLSYIATKAERAGRPFLATEAYANAKSRRSTMGQDFQGIQVADELMIEEGSPTMWVLRAENDFSDSQKIVIEPIIPVAEVQENVRKAKKQAAKDVAPDIEKLAKRLFPKGMTEMGANMRSIMEQHADSQEATRKALFDLISSNEAFDSLSAADKLKLTNELQTLWERARNKELARIYKAEVGDPDAVKKKLVEAALPKLVKRINAGALSNEAIYNALAEEFNLPVFDESIAKEVFRLAQEMQKAPEGLPRNQKYIDLLNYIASQRKLSKWETLKAYWYASILSGTGTQATNGVAAAVNVQIQNMLLAASNPRTASKIFLGAMRGYAIGFTEASPILLRGDFSNRITNEVMNESAPLEQAAKRGGPVAKFFSNMKYVSRLMAFVDTMNAMSAMEARAYHLAARKTLDKYKDTPVSQAEIDAEIFKLLNVTDEQRKHYRQVAESEAAHGFISKQDIERRTQDLMRRDRPPEIMQEALQFGKNATFNQKPVGFAGNLAEAVNAARAKFPALTIVFPFVQTPANVLNELLNYTPVALWRLAKENPVWLQKIQSLPGLNNTKSRDLSPADYQILRAQAIFGHMTAIGLGLLLASYDDEEDPPFDMTGGWYGLDGDKKRQLMAQGKRKWSIKIGETWIDYRQTPLAIMLGTLGNYQDTKKYGNERDKALNTSSLAYHGMNGAFIIKDMTFLSGFTELINLIDPDDYTPVEKRLSRFMARPITGLMPNIVQEIDTWFDPEIKRADSFLGYLQADIPVARSAMPRPMINVLGQTIRDRKTAGDRFYNQAEQDPVWQELARLSELGVFVPVPSATAKVLQNGKRVRMTDDQVYRYQLESGKLYYQKLQRDLPRIKNMDAEQAMAYFDREFPVLRERAKLLLR